MPVTVEYHASEDKPGYLVEKGLFPVIWELDGLGQVEQELLGENGQASFTDFGFFQSGKLCLLFLAYIQQMEVAQMEGIFMAPEGAATYAAFKHLIKTGFLQRHENVVLLNTGSGLKYPGLVKARFPVLDSNDLHLREKIDGR